jgi:hypothetical protein
VADGYEIEIDGDVFELDTSETIGLPDGATAGEIVLPDGATASDGFGPDGTRVFGSAIPDSVVDNFEEILYEDQNLTLSDRYGGDLSNFERQTTTVSEGSYALESQATDAQSIAQTDRTISAPVTFEFDFYRQGTSDNFEWVLYFAQNNSSHGANSGYIIWPYRSNNVLRISRLDNGILNGLNDTTITYPANEWGSVEVDHDSNGNITATAYDAGDTQLGQVSTQDTTYSSGGTGYRSGPTVAYHDNFRTL